MTSSINPIDTSIAITASEIDATTANLAANKVVSSTTVEATSVITFMITTATDTSLFLSLNGLGKIIAGVDIQMASSKALITNSVTGTNGLLNLEASIVNSMAPLLVSMLL